jgi:hypothetical protein
MQIVAVVEAFKVYVYEVGKLLVILSQHLLQTVNITNSNLSNAIYHWVDKIVTSVGIRPPLRIQERV